MGIAERKLPERNARIKLILDSAAAIFRKKGSPNSTIEDIAAYTHHTQISPEIIYHYFKSKDAKIYGRLYLLIPEGDE